MTILLIKCSSSSTAQQVVADVQAGELWGVDMGTTSKVSAYSNYTLIECTKTRHLNLFDADKDPDKFESGLEKDVAVLDQRMKVSEHRMSRVEEDIRALRTHMDRGNAIVALLVVIVPVALHFWG